MPQKQDNDSYLRDLVKELEKMYQVLADNIHSDSGGGEGDLQIASWTPTTNAYAYVTVNSSEGWYAKRGREVTIHSYINYTYNHGAYTSAVIDIANLPFTISSDPSNVRFIGISEIGGTNSFSLLAIPGTTVATTWTNGHAKQMDPLSTVNFYGYLNYFTDADG